MKKYAFLLLVVVALGACESNTDKLVTIKTGFGDMTVLLYEETPLHKANFIRLAESGQYDSTIFHRVIQEFMIQGGDIYLGTPTVEPKDARIDAEFGDRFFHKKGELAAARESDHINPEKKSSNCQFYIVQGKVWTEEELVTDQHKLNLAIDQLLQMEGYDSLNQQFMTLQREGKRQEINDLTMKCKEIAEQEIGVNLSKDISPERLKSYTSVGGTPHLDGEYTVFGRVVEGLDVIDKIAAVAKAPDDRPHEDIYIFMEITEMVKTAITKKYGYMYPDAEK